MSPAELERLALRLRDAALAAGAGQAEAFARFTDSTRVEVEKGRPEGIRKNREVAAALRVIVDGRLGLAYAAGPGERDLPLLAADALSAARLVPPRELASFPSPGRGEAFGICDEKGWADPFAGKVAMACEMEAAALGVGAAVKRTYKPTYAERRRVTAIASGVSSPRSYSDTVFSLSLEAVAEGGGEAQTGHEYASTRSLAGLSPAAVGRAAGRMALGLLGGTPPPTGERAVLFPPRLAIELLGALVPAFSAEEVWRGRSRLAGKRGEAVFSPLFTLRDDASLAGQVGSVPFDDEGVAPVPRDLVEAGVVKGFLHDLRTAARGKEPPTGNGFRGALSAQPSPSPGNLILLPGPAALDPFLAGDGVARVEEVMGAHTIDPVTGDFSLGATGFLLSPRAEPVPFRNAAIAGNLFDLFAGLAAVGDDLEVRGNHGSPTLLASRILVTGL